MTPEEWIGAAESELRAESRAGYATTDASAAALEVLLRSWKESIADGISCSVVVHDLKEVAHQLGLIHDALSDQLPGILDELSEIDTD